MFRYKPNFGRKRKLLREWFNELTTSGDIIDTFHWTIHSWGAFRRHFFEKHVGLFIEVRDHKIVAAFWTSPCLDGAEIGAWIRRDFRGNRGIFRSYLQLLAKLASRLPVVVACTIQESVEKLLLHVGFQQVGAVPEAWDGETLKMFAFNRANIKPFWYKE